MEKNKMRKPSFTSEASGNKIIETAMNYMKEKVGTNRILSGIHAMSRKAITENKSISFGKHLFAEMNNSNSFYPSSRSEALCSNDDTFTKLKRRNRFGNKLLTMSAIVLLLFFTVNIVEVNAQALRVQNNNMVRIFETGHMNVGNLIILLF
jgi:hypothetical protein